MFEFSLTENQWKKVSEITSNLGLISITSVVIPSLFGGQPNLLNSMLGLLIAIVLLSYSIIIARKHQ